MVEEDKAEVLVVPAAARQGSWALGYVFVPNAAGRRLTAVAYPAANPSVWCAARLCSEDRLALGHPCNPPPTLPQIVSGDR